MKSKRQWGIAVFIVSVAVLAMTEILYFDEFKTGAKSIVEKFQNRSRIACILKSDIILYGTDSCAACAQQKEVFGDNWDAINYVGCDQDFERCFMNDIGRYPTWMYMGQRYQGFKTIQELAQLTGCR